MTSRPTAQELAERKQALIDSLTPGEDFRIFGYGSLMWEPGFDFLDARPAWLHGWHRAFCMYSFRYRGTPERPGLVLGLDRGGSCRGIAFRVAATQAVSVIDYLWRREMVNGVYEPRLLSIRVGSARVGCYAFVADRRHAQYAGGLPISEMERIIRESAGEKGANADYLANTVRHLDEMGIKDGQLHRLLRRLRA